MRLNIEKLKDNIKLYNDLLENYESTCMNFYYEAESNTRYWNSGIANYFFSLIDEEKKENKIFFEELKSLKLVFDYLIDNYQNYGKKITLDLESKDAIINRLSNYKTSDISYLLNDSDLDVININKSKAKIKNIEKNISKYKEEYKKICNKIESIEEEIKVRLSKIVVSSVEEVDSVAHSLGTVDEIFIDIDNLENSVKKLDMYYREEYEIFDDLKLIFKDISYNYVTNNKDILEVLCAEIVAKFKIFLSNHSNNIKLLNDNIEQTKLTSVRSKMMFDGIRNVEL